MGILNRVHQFSRHALRHAKNTVAEEIYLKNGSDLTKPVSIYGLVNERCNYKCRYCEYWRLENYKAEMSTEEWTKAIKSLKDFLGPYQIQFSGGEPYLRKDFLDIGEFCQKENISWGVTTNGSAFVSAKIIERTVAARPFSVNISIDGPTAETHDYARGVPGSLEKISAGIKALRQERDRQGADFSIIIKPTVHAKNLHSIVDIADWVDKLGATAVNFQPVDRWTPETYDELWIGPERHAELDTVVKELLRQKQKGVPILNSELTLNHWGAHFREEAAAPELLPCRVGMRNYFIRTNGDVELCWFYPTVGNVKEKSAREIWHGAAAQEIRKKTVECTKLCLFTCLSQKTLLDKASMALTMLKKEIRST